ncbi:MAG: lipoate--protein ligase family protein [Spirulinaceae cyanobacterium RM2_2_10]|nr:lipoate--protein ligase family protein [Spirulinaceae cyanobacterium SM2_1_0]NJO19692.1 lipoate--protein ligase family protein [Spirulinaceae cyanobacterium RM2_2_10]
MSRTNPSRRSLAAPPRTWRYVPLLAAPGAVQMALDLWLWAQHCQGKCGPVLRFYTWQPAAISLGYHQHRYPAAWRNLAWQGQMVERVRRPTGGRAVLHDGDLTYAIAHAQLPGSRQQVYQQFGAMLIAGWRSLGVELHYGTAGRDDVRAANCFALATAADLVTTEGTKVIGSAQRWQGKAVLQHGSMRLGAGSGLYEQVFGEPEPPRLAVAPAQAIAALKTACQAHFAAKLSEQPLSSLEWQAVQALAARIQAGEPPSLSMVTAAGR